MGCAIAHFLLADPAFDRRVVVIERDPSYKRASSALSASSIRQQFSTPENIRMSRLGFDFLRQIGEHLAVDGDSPDVGLVERGYLYLVGPEHAPIAREIHDVQLAEGADVVLLSPAELEKRYPWMSTQGVALGSLGRSGEGWFDGYALLQAFRRAAIARGASFLVAEAVGFRATGGRVAAVELADGQVVPCDAVVNAAGPWAREVAAMAGVELPVHAHRRTVFRFESPVPYPDAPLVIDTSGAWFRPEGEGFIGAISPDPADDRPDLPLEADHRLWEKRLWPALAERVPAFDRLRRTSGWAGYYEMNTFDHNAILGPHPEVTNLHFANGFSGHGIQHAPAVGRAIAERLVHGRYLSLDLSIFSFDRIAAGRRVVERNVIG
jgi:glycine/D-amino acid oxidase-like deaminating enzyme